MLWWFCRILGTIFVHQDCSLSCWFHSLLFATIVTEIRWRARRMSSIENWGCSPMLKISLIQTTIGSHPNDAGWSEGQGSNRCPKKVDRPLVVPVLNAAVLEVLVPNTVAYQKGVLMWGWDKNFTNSQVSFLHLRFCILLSPCKPSDTTCGHVRFRSTCSMMPRFLSQWRLLSSHLCDVQTDIGKMDNGKCNLHSNYCSLA